MTDKNTRFFDKDFLNYLSIHLIHQKLLDFLHTYTKNIQSKNSVMSQ